MVVHELPFRRGKPHQELRDVTSTGRLHQSHSTSLDFSRRKLLRSLDLFGGAFFFFFPRKAFFSRFFSHELVLSLNEVLVYS